MPVCASPRFNQRTTPALQGEVIHVSADVIDADSSGPSHYLARIRLRDAEAIRLHNLSPVPGMPVEVFINTGDRTFSDYILQPVMDSFLARLPRELSTAPQCAFKKHRR